MFGREPQKRTSADILEELQTAIRSAVEELAGRRDIALQDVQTNTQLYVPTIAGLVVEAVGSRRALADAKVQGSGDATGSGPSNVLPSRPTVGQVISSKASQLAARIANARKQ